MIEVVIRAAGWAIDKLLPIALSILAIIIALRALRAAQAQANAQAKVTEIEAERARAERAPRFRLEVAKLSSEGRGPGHLTYLGPVDLEHVLFVTPLTNDSGMLERRRSVIWQGINRNSGDFGPMRVGEEAHFEALASHDEPFRLILACTTAGGDSWEVTVETTGPVTRAQAVATAPAAKPRPRDPKRQELFSEPRGLFHSRGSDGGGTI